MYFSVKGTLYAFDLIMYALCCMSLVVCSVTKLMLGITRDFVQALILIFPVSKTEHVYINQMTIHSHGITQSSHKIKTEIIRNTCACFQTGWMMWNWMVSALSLGAAIVCYDGSPLVPNENVLWDLVDELRYAAGVLRGTS